MSISFRDPHNDSRLSLARRFGRDSRSAVTAAPTPPTHSPISNLARSSRRKV
jgi:hypothetical protein